MIAACGRSELRAQSSGGGHDPQISNRVLLWPRIMAEAQYIACVTCQQVDPVLAQVEALDRAGRRIMLVDWTTGEIEHHDKRMATSIVPFDHS